MTIFNSVLRFTQQKITASLDKGRWTAKRWRDFLYENSLFLQNIDKLIFASIVLVFLSSTVMPSDVIGFIALITIFLTFVKLIFKPNEKLEYSTFELWLLAYFMIVVISLAGSTLFHLSLKGFFKTFTYLAFYVSVAQYLKNNKGKIPYILGVIGACVSFEAVIGVIQNFSHVSEISTWQDVSKLNPEQVMTRVYGTLKPLNPNLLGGYFVAGIPALYGLSAYLYIAGKTKAPSPLWGEGRGEGLIVFIFALLSTVVLFLTGCRGSYMAMMVIFFGIFAVASKFLWHKHKKIFLTAIGSVVAIVASAILLVSSLRARVLSIFAMRGDSSNSFRFNVYHSSLDMFKDNWLLGIGVGNQNFREIYGLYMKTGFDALSAYNIFLEIAVESGIFALIAFLGFLVTLIKNSVKYILKSTDTKSVILVSTALISICAVCFHGFVDTVFFRPQIQFIFWTMVAVVKAIKH
ncbi:O-antigen ligase family protein [bacterium]|nr:O-antigen ligase family protein [bacterium]